MKVEKAPNYYVAFTSMHGQLNSHIIVKATEFDMSTVAGVEAFHKYNNDRGRPGIVITNIFGLDD